MENPNSLEPQAGVQVDNLPKETYYKNGLRKFLDFLIGFLGSILFYSFAGFGINLFGSNGAGFLPMLLIFVFLVILFFKIGRKFIAIGIISILAIPLLFLGSCLLLAGAGAFR